MKLFPFQKHAAVCFGIKNKNKKKNKLAVLWYQINFGKNMLFHTVWTFYLKKITRETCIISFARKLAGRLFIKININKIKEDEGKVDYRKEGKFQNHSE